MRGISMDKPAQKCSRGDGIRQNRKPSEKVSQMSCVIFVTSWPWRGVRKVLSNKFSGNFDQTTVTEHLHYNSSSEITDKRPSTSLQPARAGPAGNSVVQGNLGNVRRRSRCAVDPFIKDLLNWELYEYTLIQRVDIIPW